MLQEKTRNKGEQDALTEEIASLKSHSWSLKDCNQNCSLESLPSPQSAFELPPAVRNFNFEEENAVSFLVEAMKSGIV